MKTRGVTPYFDPRENDGLRSQPADAYEASISFAGYLPIRWKETYWWRTKLEAMFHANKTAMVEGVRGRRATGSRNQILTRCFVHHLMTTVVNRYGE